MSKNCWRKGAERNFIFHRGLASSCCQALPEKLINFRSLDGLQDHWKQEAHQLDQGIELPGCNACWRYENQNITSYRQVEDNSQTPSINIFVDNLCNQMCSYCGPNYSSTWEQSFNDYGPFNNISENTKHHQLKLVNGDSVDVEFWMNQIETYVNSFDDNKLIISLLGGEPLMQIKNLELLSRFDVNKIKFLNVVTNLNPPNNKFLLRILEIFPTEKLNFSISIDASPEYNHVPRAGFDKDRFLSNLNLLKQKKAPIKFFSVFSVLGIFDFDNYLNWVNKQECEFEINLVNNPQCLDLRYLPLQFREKIFKRCQAFDLPAHLRDILTANDTVVDQILNEQYNYLIQYFTRTNTDPEKINNLDFQEYWSWLKDFNENSTGIRHTS